MGNRLAAERVKGRVAVAVVVMLPFAVGLHGRVARVLEKATVPVSNDGLEWIRRTRRSLAAGGPDLLIWAAIRCCGGELGLDLCALDKGEKMAADGGCAHSLERRSPWFWAAVGAPDLLLRGAARRRLEGGSAGCGCAG